MVDPVPKVSQSSIPGPSTLTLTWPVTKKSLIDIHTVLGNFHVGQPDVSVKLSQPLPPPQAAAGVKVVEHQVVLFKDLIIEWSVKAALENLTGKVKPGAEAELEIKSKKLEGWSLKATSEIHFHSEDGHLKILPQPPVFVIQGTF